MPHLLDSDIIIDYLTVDPAIVLLVDGLIPGGIAISVIGYMEAYQGALRSVTRADTLTEFAASVPILDVTPAIARRCAEVRESLQQQGKRVRPRALDLIVAATALEHGLILVTRNTDDYKDIPGLTLHRW